MIPRGEARRLFIDAARANGRVVVEHVDAVYRHYTAELPDFSALDAGAFHGNYALRLSRSPNCRLVYAVEGEPRNFARLRQALEASPYGATVRPVEVALQSQAAVRVARLMPSLSHPARSGTMSIWAGSPGVTFGEAVEAPAGTIDSLTARSRWPLAFAVLARVYPAAADSVLNFGLPAMSGQLASKIDVSLLERAIRQAILRFEPRVMEDSLEVKALDASSVLDTHNVIEFEIRGFMWAQPVPLELLLRTQVDLEAGQVEVRDAVSGAVSRRVPR